MLGPLGTVLDGGTWKAGPGIGRISGYVVILLKRPFCFAVTNLQVSKSKRTLTLSGKQAHPAELLSQVPDQPELPPLCSGPVLNLRMLTASSSSKPPTTSAFNYGTYARRRACKARLQFERHASGGLFSLTVRGPRSVTVAATAAMWKSGC